jgi:tetratricopeptide (TPR) repeat protein
MTSYTPDELIDRGQLHISAGQPDLAIPFLRQLVAQYPNHALAWEVLGEALFDMGDADEAKSCFQRSVDIAPEEVGTKWMFLGQLSHGHDALRFYEHGILLMEREGEVRKKQLASAHVSVAELFMSDLCMDDDAEARCELACEHARRLDPDSLEALQTTASMRVSQMRVEEAKEIMTRVGARLGVMKDDEQYSSYEFRLQTCKMLVELDEHGMALGLLERLVEEDDEIAEAWMLLGLVHKAHMDSETAGECYDRAADLLSEFAEEDEGFAAMLERVEALRLELVEEDEKEKQVKKKKRSQ